MCGQTSWKGSHVTQVLESQKIQLSKQEGSLLFQRLSEDLKGQKGDGGRKPDTWQLRKPMGEGHDSLGSDSHVTDITPLDLVS